MDDLCFGVKQERLSMHVQAFSFTTRLLKRPIRGDSAAKRSHMGTRLNRSRAGGVGGDRGRAV